jgi:hypothetical protein
MSHNPHEITNEQPTSVDWRDPTSDERRMCRISGSSVVRIADVGAFDNFPSTKVIACINRRKSNRYENEISEYRFRAHWWILSGNQVQQVEAWGKKNNHDIQLLGTTWDSVALAEKEFVQEIESRRLLIALKDAARWKNYENT